MEARLVVLSGEHKDREIPLPETVFLIGRRPECHLRPHSPTVSGLHCAIAAWAGKVRIRDLKSRNGTYLNGQLVSGEVAVQDGDRLQVGTHEFGFRIKHEHVYDVLGTPIRDEGEINWLLESTGDSSVLKSSHKTSVLTPELQQADGDVDHPSEPDWQLLGEAAVDAQSQNGDDNRISAGHHFRAYFEQRKKTG